MRSNEFLDIKVRDGMANEDTWEKIGRFKTALNKRVLAFIEKAPRYAGYPRGVLQQTVERIAFDMYTLPEFFTELLKKFSEEKRGRQETRVHCQKTITDKRP